MNVVSFNDLVLGDKVGKGASGEVRKCTFEGNQYCIKIVDKFYHKSVVSNIKNMTKEDFSKEYFVPLYIVEGNTGNFYGYLMNYDETLKEATKIRDFHEKLIFLKNARRIIDNLHSEYKMVHGDLVSENMLYDELLNAFLIDFDSSLKFGKKYEDKQTVRLFVQQYLRYYPVDKNMDIYTFNVTTLKMLGSVPIVNLLFQDIATNDFNMFQDKKEVRKLTKELLLKDTRKEYSGEYIIDYL